MRHLAPHYYATSRRGGGGVNPVDTKWESIGFFTSQLMIFQLYMWRDIDVQADWYGHKSTATLEHRPSVASRCRKNNLKHVHVNSRLHAGNKKKQDRYHLIAFSYSARIWVVVVLWFDKMIIIHKVEITRNHSLFISIHMWGSRADG